MNLFFVLSGFLITRILLEQRQTIDGKYGVLRSLGVFYARRALRIFPLYYSALAVLWVCDFQQSREYGWWLATYTYNVRIAAVGLSQTYDHFWTLCVEEQFYLIWPAVLLTLSPRWLPKILGVAFLVVPAWRVGCLGLAATTRMPLYVATFACFDCLAAGALLAYFQNERIGWQNFLNRCRIVGVALMVLWVVVCMLQRPWTWHHVTVEWIFGNTAMAIFFAWVVGRAAERRDGDWNVLLSSAVRPGEGVQRRTFPQFTWLLLVFARRPARWLVAVLSTPLTRPLEGHLSVLDYSTAARTAGRLLRNNFFQAGCLLKERGTWARKA